MQQLLVEQELLCNLVRRIKNGDLNLADKIYKLDINNDGNTLHGGKKSISHRFWNVGKIENGLCFSIKSFHLDNGYPANVEIKISYILNNNELLIKYFATTDNLTYLNLTNHSYFNLSGNPDNIIYEDILKINSDYLVGINENSIPCETIALDNNIFDFRKAKKLKDKSRRPIVNDYKSQFNSSDTNRLLRIITDVSIIAVVGYRF